MALSTDKDVGENKTFTNFEPTKTINSKEVDRKLSFHHHITNICKKADQKQKALLKPKTISSCLEDRKENFLQYIDQVPIQFCSLVWMFCFRKLINKVLERPEFNLQGQ